MAVPVTTIALVGVIATALMIVAVLALVAMAMNDDRHGPGRTGEPEAEVEPQPDDPTPEDPTPDENAA